MLCVGYFTLNAMFSFAFLASLVFNDAAKRNFKFNML